jgi:hypothetical protein
VAGTLTIPAGATSAQIIVPVAADLLDEAAETFVVSISDPSGGSITNATGTGRLPTTIRHRRWPSATLR